jgi:hypothetical protein
MTRRLIMVVALLVATVMLAPSAFAGGSTVVNGGGTGSLSATGTPPFSQFGMGVRILGDGAAAGHFNCLMGGAGTLLYNFQAGDGRTQKADVTFAVNVTEGGPGAGILQLTVTGVPFVPGGVAAFPPEFVASGQITIH